MTPSILALSCSDRSGIVASVTGLLQREGGNITEAQQFNDAGSDRFFMRVGFDIADLDAFRTAFAPLGKTLGMDWRLRDARRAKRVLILVSKFDHCLVDLLYRTRLGELDMDIVGIVSNHPREAIRISNLHGAPFHHLPINRDTKAEQEARLRALIEETDAELVVLARYMQILSDGLSRDLAGRCVNIHHSFLPGFKGARPYHQAHRRGVKMIGATAHFVTPDLDEGPIIAQGVEPITHADTPERLVAKGRSIEQRVLSRAVKALIEDRVFLNGQRTVVFD
ncbi:MAG: formyltetrahydrofolate deformylase [Litorimonas sp.]